MRNWIDLCENAPAATTVYHGGKGRIDQVRIPFFTTTHYEMAHSYAEEKGGGEGIVTAFELDENAHICYSSELMKIADEAGLDHEGCHNSDLLYEESYREVMLPLLIERGFDAVFMYDFGYHSDFAEEETFIILNPAILLNARVVEEKVKAA